MFICRFSIKFHPQQRLGHIILLPWSHSRDGQQTEKLSHKHCFYLDIFKLHLKKNEEAIEITKLLIKQTQKLIMLKFINKKYVVNQSVKQAKHGILLTCNQNISYFIQKI
jgi:hypothetical protein